MTYTDECLERAERAKRRLHDDPPEYGPNLTDLDIEKSIEDSVELARRLNRAISYLRSSSSEVLKDLADELEKATE